MATEKHSVTDTGNTGKKRVRLLTAKRIFLIALFTFAGIMHFVNPEPFNSIMPKIIPGTPTFWTYLSGIAELTCAALLSLRRTRRLGGICSALLMLAVWPANFEMFYQWSDRPWPEYLAALLRLPLQIPLIWWSWQIWKYTDQKSFSRPN